MRTLSWHNTTLVSPGSHRLKSWTPAWLLWSPPFLALTGLLPEGGTLSLQSATWSEEKLIALDSEGQQALILWRRTLGSNCVKCLQNH